MSLMVKKQKLWLVPVCLLIAVVASVCCWQQLQAQAPATPGAPGAPGAAPTAAPMALQPGELTFSLSTVLPKAVKVMRIKNWDGQVTELLRFKYKTMDNKVITVHLPGVYRKEKMTKASWDTLFRVFAMDLEVELEAIERNRPPDMSAYMAKFMAEVRGATPEGAYGNPAAGAMGYARSSLPSMGVQLPPMPPPLIGML